MEKTVEELRAESSAIHAKLRAAEHLVRDKEHRALVGKTFRYHNSGGYPSGRWWLYCKVTKAAAGQIHMFEFQHMPDGTIEVRTRNKSLRLLDGFIPISAKEYNAAWRGLKKKINAF